MLGDISYPSVEVFILVYNDGAVARKGIESVLDQTYNNLRLTILENGSSDHTRSVISEFADDPRVRIIRNESNIRSGLATPYMMQSTADWQAILFADDYYAHDRIEKMVAAAGDFDAVFSNNIFVDEEGCQIMDPPDYISTVKDVSHYSVDEHLRKFYIQGNSLHPCAMLIRTEVYKKLGGFPKFLHRLGDMYFFTKLLANHPVKLMAERLQYITVWTDKRNESALNVRNPMPAELESTNFTQLYAEEPILSRIDKIFSSHLEPISFKSDAERLWYLGNVTLRYCGSFRREFGFRCLYKAILMDGPGIDSMMLASKGVSGGVYVGQLAELHWPQGSELTGPITLRQWARQFKGLVFFWMALYRRPRLFISNLSRRQRVEVSVRTDTKGKAHLVAVEEASPSDTPISPQEAKRELVES